MFNTLCCWLCRIRSDLFVPSLSSLCLSFSPTFSPSPPSFSQTRVWIRSLLVTLAIWGETLSSHLSPFLALLMRTASHMWHGMSYCLPCRPVGRFYSLTAFTVCGRMAGQLSIHEHIKKFKKKTLNTTNRSAKIDNSCNDSFQLIWIQFRIEIRCWIKKIEWVNMESMKS